MIPWLLVAAAGWAAWKSWRHARGWGWPVAFSAVAAAVLAGAVWASVPEEEGIDWIAYEPGILETIKAEDRVAIIDFTADWCINCKVLERTVLETDAVAGGSRTKVSLS